MSKLDTYFSLFIACVFLSLDSEIHQKISILDNREPQVTLKSNIDAMNLLFLLCPSGTYVCKIYCCMCVSD